MGKTGSFNGDEWHGLNNKQSPPPSLMQGITNPCHPETEDGNNIQNGGKVNE